MLANIPHEHRPLLILSGLVLLMLALFLGFKTWLTFREALQVGKPVPYEYTVGIEGIGVAKVKPDTAKVSFNVESRKKSQAEAQIDNTTRTNRFLEQLIATGIEKKDIQTTTYTSFEDTTYDEKTASYKSLGWMVIQTIDVTIRDLEKISTVLTLLGQNNATKISGPNFSVENDQVAVNEAREKALADAKQKMEAISRQLGIELGTPTSYSEWKEDGGYYGYAARSEMGDANEPTVEPGENTVKLHVSLSYIIER